MAEDLDIESLLEEPYKKKETEVSLNIFKLKRLYILNQYYFGYIQNWSKENNFDKLIVWYALLLILEKLRIKLI